MRKLPLLLIAAMLLFSACAEEEFTLSGLSIAMERKASSDASGLTDENAVLRISAEVSQPGSIYTFRLVSPDGDLVWEGAMNAVEEGSDILVSDPAEITAGALFPEGEYSLIIYSDSGTEVSDTVSFSYEHSLRHFQDGELIGNADVAEYDAAGNLLRSKSRTEGYLIPHDAASAAITYIDSEGNSTEITESFLP